MDEKQTFINGFFQGWQSVAGPTLQPPEIQAPSPQPSGSRFIHGLIEGIEAAKKKMAELNLAELVRAPPSSPQGAQARLPQHHGQQQGQ